MERDSHTDEEIKQVFSLKKIVVIGMSKHSAKAAHFVPKYLSEQGFDITPINPNATIKKKPKVIWLQEGIHNSEAEELARSNGIMVIFNRCMLAEHQRLF